MTIRRLAGQPVKVTITADCPHVCPVDGSDDRDTVAATYDAATGVIEAESFVAMMDAYAFMAVTAEELADLVRRDLAACDIAAVVTVTGVHGGAFVEATAGP